MRLIKIDHKPERIFVIEIDEYELNAIELSLQCMDDEGNSNYTIDKLNEQFGSLLSKGTYP